MKGTAMLEIVHDIAPGAQLFFATGRNGFTSFAQNIRDLRTAGCDIIIDDFFFFAEIGVSGRAGTRSHLDHKWRSSYSGRQRCHRKRSARFLIRRQ